MESTIILIVRKENELCPQGCVDAERLGAFHWTIGLIQPCAMPSHTPNGRVDQIGFPPRCGKTDQRKKFPCPKEYASNVTVEPNILVSAVGRGRSTSKVLTSCPIIIHACVLGGATNQTVPKRCVETNGAPEFKGMTPVAELMQCMRSSHAASGLPLVSFHASCIMHPEEEKGTWRRAQTGRRVGDADERSGKQRFQTGICRHFFFWQRKRSRFEM